MLESSASSQINLKFVREYQGEVTIVQPRRKNFKKAIQEACEHFGVDPLYFRFLLDDGTRIDSNKSVEAVRAT